MKAIKEAECLSGNNNNKNPQDLTKHVEQGQNEMI